MRAADLVTAAVLMLLGGVVLYDAVRLGIGWGLEGPGSGFFPFWLALLLVITGGTVFARAARRAGTGTFVTRERLVPVLKVALPMLGFIVLTAPPGPGVGLGLYVASGLYLAFYMRWIGGHRWRTVIMVAVAFPIIAFVVFEQWFLVPMPKGPLEAWLGY
jgi:hypothetical protein